MGRVVGRRKKHRKILIPERYEFCLNVASIDNKKSRANV